MENKKLKIIFFGTPQEVVPVLENLLKHFEVTGVVTTPDKKSGRKQLITSPPVKIVAQKNAIPVLQPQDLAKSAYELSHIPADLFIVAAYGKIIPDAILHLPKLGAINIHPSLLPKYRGSTPLQTALLNGDKSTGVTFIQMDEQMDHGPILHQIPFALETTDTFAWLMQSTFTQAAIILPHVIEDYASGKIIPQPQDDNKATFTKMITKQDGYIDLDHPPAIDQFDHMVRAFYPWPTVWTNLKLKVSDEQAKIIKFLPEKKIQVEGKNQVSLKDFLNGYPELKEKLEKLFRK